MNNGPKNLSDTGKSKLLNLVSAGMLLLGAEGCATMSGVKPLAQNGQKPNITVTTKCADKAESLPKNDADDIALFADGNRLLGQSRERFAFCFNRALKRDPDAGGTLKVMTTINPDGSVKDVDFEENSTTDNEEVRGCVSSAVREWRFAEGKKGKVRQIRFPIDFVVKD